MDSDGQSAVDSRSRRMTSRWLDRRIQQQQQQHFDPTFITNKNWVIETKYALICSHGKIRGQ